MFDQIKPHQGQKNIRAISKAVSVVENRLDGYFDLMNSVYDDTKKAPIIGITGAPGAGKSTFINQLIKKIASTGQSVAVVAVDPSSVYSGGALLGDRIRMDENYPIDQVYIRSIATRGDLGGLCRSVSDIAQIFRVAGYDYIIVESVGVGQSEIEIRDVADIVLLLLLEGTGDDIQFIKAGIMEIADLFVINKIDINPPKRILTFLHTSDFVKSDEQVIPTDSISGNGFDNVFHKINELSHKCRDRLRLTDQSLEHQIEYSSKLMKDEFDSYIHSEKGKKIFANLLSQSKSPYKVVENFHNKIQKILEGLE